MTRSILIAESQPAVRSALRLWIEQQPGLHLTGEVTNGPDLLQAVVARPADVLLLDWSLPGLPIGQLLRLVRFEQPRLRVIAMSGRPEDRRPALAAGADAFACKGDSPHDLLVWLREETRRAGGPDKYGGSSNER